MKLRIALLVSASLLYAGTGPQPPCGGEAAVPSIPALADSPRIQVWTSSDLEAEWKPPECTGWKPSGFASVVVTAARFRFTAGMDGWRRKIGAVSRTAGILYWSTTQKRWQKLVLDAHALAGPDGGPRSDFSADEVAEGRTLYFEQEDNVFGKAIFRLRIKGLSARRLVFDVENAGVVRYMMIPLFQPGELQSVYYLEQEDGNIWRYYSIARTRGKAATLITGHAASAVNRAVAFYRHLAGIPTDQEPPAAR